MARISKSDIKAAVSAIVEREQRKGIASPILHVNEGNRIWIRSNLRKNLEPVFSKIGLEKDEIQVIVARHQDEVRQYLKAQEPKTARLLSGLTKSYQKALGNRQAAIRHLAGAPFISAPLILDKPVSIFVYPSGMLVEDHIESGNSWAKLIWTDSQSGDWVHTTTRFFFAWTNPSDYMDVRGQCTASAFPGLIFGGQTAIFVTTQLKVHLAGIALGGYDQEQSITSFVADTWGSIFGGDDETLSEDILSTKSLSYKQILVDVHQLL